MEMDNRTALETSHGNFSSRDTGMTKTELYILVLEHILSFEFLVCFLANLLTISAVAKFDFLHKKPTNILIVSLSVADGCVGFNSITNLLNLHYRADDTFSEIVCIAHVWFSYISLSGNILNILLIAVERTITVYHPLRSINWMTPRSAKQMAVSLWTVIVIKTSLEVALAGSYKPHINCYLGSYFTRSLMISMTMVFFCVSLSTFVLYICIFRKIVKQNRKRESLSTKISTKNRTTKMMAILMGTYYGFFLPQVISENVEYDPTIKQYLSPFLYLMFFWNAIVNPVVYAWMSRDFRTAFRAILRLKSPESHGTESTIICTEISVRDSTVD